MHIWLHYPRLTLRNGPVIHYSTMKFERKNKELKETAVGTSVGTTSNINLPLTIAIMHQLKLCYTTQFCAPMHGDIALGPIDNLNASLELEYLISNLAINVMVSTLKNIF